MNLGPIPIAAAAGIFAAAAVFSSCTKKTEDLAGRGRAVYLSVCIACHNADPRKAGTLGPEIWGSSLELLQARITRGAYPPGYRPKRPTHVMQPLPQAQRDIAAIHAFLNSP